MRNGKTPALAPQQKFLSWDSVSGESSTKPNGIKQAGKYEVQVTADLHGTNRSVWSAIYSYNKLSGNTPSLYNSGGVMVRPFEDPKLQSITMEIVKPNILRNELSKFITFTTYERVKTQGSNGDERELMKKKETLPPTYLMEDLLSTSNPPLPQLNRIISVPVFDRCGELIVDSGYNFSNGFLYRPVRGLKVESLPEEITEADLNKAKSLLDELIWDFPFEEDADRHNSLSLAITPMVREMIDGAIPLHLVDASKPGSGKGKLVRTLVGITIGQNFGSCPQPKDDSELRKRITSALMSAPDVIIIDNIFQRLDSGALATVLTEPVWTDRILGASQMFTTPVRALFAATGNNTTLSAELTRRTIRMRLVPKTAHPEDRDDFRHSNLEGWARQIRGNLLWACHILVKWWIQQGQPAPPIKLLGSFEEWTRVVGGIIYAAGYDKFLTNRKKLQSASDQESRVLSAFCAAVYDYELNLQGKIIHPYRNAKVTTGDLLEIAEDVDGINLWGNSTKGRQTSLGRYLGKYVDSIVEEQDQADEGETPRRFQIKKAGTSKGSQLWQIILLGRE